MSFKRKPFDWIGFLERLHACSHGIDFVREQGSMRAAWNSNDADPSHMDWLLDALMDQEGTAATRREFLSDIEVRDAPGYYREAVPYSRLLRLARAVDARMKKGSS